MTMVSIFSIANFENEKSKNDFQILAALPAKKEKLYSVVIWLDAYHIAGYFLKGIYFRTVH